MRMFVIFLFILNGMFFIGHHWWPKETVIVLNDSPDAKKSIQLKRERVTQASVVAQVNKPSGLATSKYVCRTVGPFTDRQAAEGLKQSLQAYARQITIRVINESGPYRYWVYLPVKNNEEAVEFARILAEKQVADYYIMGSGDDSRVSLGRFKEKTYADKRLQQIKEFDLGVESEVIFKHYQLNWLDYELLEAQLDQVGDIIKPYMQDEISLLTRECEI